jgi:hypothetical protein
MAPTLTTPSSPNTWPQPTGIATTELGAGGGSWNAELGECLLPYEAVRTAPDRRAVLLDFLEATYRAGSARASWAPELG